MVVIRDRAKRMRALVWVLESECNVRTEASYDGKTWVLSWDNGPPLCAAKSLRIPCGWA
jgi:hypothetical protein